MLHIHITTDHGLHCWRVPGKPEAHRAGDLRRENPSTEKGYLTYTYYDDTYTQNATSMYAFRCKLDIVADSMVLWSANYLYIVLYLHPK